MKKMSIRLSVLTVFALFFAFNTSAQVLNIPEKSKKDFETRFPNAENVEWTNNLARYVVDFTLDNAGYRSHYYINGSWWYTEKFLEKEQLPQPVITSYEKSRISDWEYLSSAFVENKNNLKAYRLEAKRGIEKKYIYYDENGKEIKAAIGL